MEKNIIEKIENISHFARVKELDREHNILESWSTFLKWERSAPAFFDGLCYEMLKILIRG